VGVRKKKHCKRGHLLKKGNLYFRTNGDRECKTCAKQRYKRNHKQILEYRKQRREFDIAKKYNISVEEYRSLFEKQNNRCAICGQKCTTNKRLAVDHDHITKKIRGLLCLFCNTGIGKFKDDINLLRKAITYLEGR
jgi:hypothetical protein